MTTRLNLGEIPVNVQFKDIKNLHLSVYPPKGSVRISAPNCMKIEMIRVFAISKLGWIKAQQKKFINQERETQKDYIDRESHYVWGKRYLLKVKEDANKSQVIQKHSVLVLQTRGKVSKQKREEIIESWYREILKIAAEPLIKKWEVRLKVKSKKLFVQKMRTKWGSCNPNLGNIRLNTSLAKKPKEFLEYIIVHELAHLIEPTHNARFTDLMDQHMPRWIVIKSELNALPIMENIREK